MFNGSERCLIAVLLWLAASSADAWQPDPVVMRGFLTLGITSSDDSVL